jgi:hypothetical protein
VGAGFYGLGDKGTLGALWDLYRTGIFYISGRETQRKGQKYGGAFAGSYMKDMGNGPARLIFCNFATICSKRVDKRGIAIYNIDRPL